MLGVAIGIVVNLGGLIGQAEGDGVDGIGEGGEGFLSGIADAVGGSFDERRMLRIPLKNIIRAMKVIPTLPILFPSLAFAASGGKVQPWYSHFAFYIGFLLDLKIFYLTLGACLGGFGCLAAGGGIKLGNFGIGLLFPIMKWW
jgi:hypothetical protein